MQIVIHIPKNLQEGDPKTDFLSEYFPKLLKRTSVFRASVVVGPFSLKRKSITMTFEFDISKDMLVLRNTVGCYQNRNNSQTFVLE